MQAEILIEMFTWPLAFLTVIGVVLNVKKHRSCFFIWSLTNIFWVIYNYSTGSYAQSAVFAVYFCLAIWGIIRWGRDAGKETKEA